MKNKEWIILVIIVIVVFVLYRMNKKRIDNIGRG